MIAHRLQTIVHADQIIVMQRGGIAEQGTHEELMQRQGVYAKMYTNMKTAYRGRSEVLHDIQQILSTEP